MEDLKKALEIKDPKERMEKVDELLGPQPDGCQRYYYSNTRTSNDCTSAYEVQNCVRITDCPNSSDNQVLCSSWNCG